MTAKLHVPRRRSALVALAFSAFFVQSAQALVAYRRWSTDQIVVAQNDGSSSRMIARGDSPVPSPDGRFIAYNHHLPYAPQLYTDALRVASMTRKDPRLDRLVAVDESTGGGFTTWSPDSQWLVAGDADRGGAWLFNLRLTRRTFIPLRFDFLGAAFSPSSKTLVISDIGARFGDRLVVVQLASHVRYRRRVRPLLDDAREIEWVQARTLPRGQDLTAGLRRVAGVSFAGISFDSPANAGYLGVGLTSRTDAGRINAALMRRGILDISAILPAQHTERQLNKASDSLRRPLGAALSDCHANWGVGRDAIFIDVANTIRPDEVVAMDRAIQHTHTWVVISVQGSDVCGVAN